MSTSSISLTLPQARAAGQAVLQELAGVIERGEIAGSVRRGKPAGISDIDIVLEPAVETRLDGSIAGWDPAFLARLRACPRWAVLNKDLNPATRQIKLESAKTPGFLVELFCSDAVRYGWILLLRTGPDDFTKALVVLCRDRGNHHFEGGAMWHRPPGGEPVPVMTSNERAVFDALQLPYIEPEQRSEETLRRLCRDHPYRGTP